MSMRHYDFAEIPFCNVKRERLLLKKKKIRHTLLWMLQEHHIKKFYLVKSI